VKTLFSRAWQLLSTWSNAHVDPLTPTPDMNPEQVAALRARSERVSLVRALPFLSLHVACIGVFWTGWSATAVLMALGLYLLRMHAITGWYHRYFSHRAFKTNRVWQFVWALIGNSTFQRGPLWWAAHHRHHHRHSDEVEDTHSPMRKGFWYSHTGWIFAPINYRSRIELVPDLARVPELMWVDRNDVIIPILCALASWLAGLVLAHVAPGLHTGPWQLLVWYLISTVVVAHATFTINSIAHVVGSRRFETSDTSRNNWLLALLTLGEGWHNNHHHYQSAARQGFRWYEIDISWYLLLLQSRLGLVHDLKQVPERILHPGRVVAPAAATAEVTSIPAAIHVPAATALAMPIPIAVRPVLRSATDVVLPEPAM
jgi:stearoyl-CoA desaturase (delta-9 desaturase)